MTQFSSQNLRPCLAPDALLEVARLTAELEDLLTSTTEPVLYFSDQPGTAWITFWREEWTSQVELALALPTDDYEPVERHISSVLMAGLGEDLVDPEDDVVLIDWDSQDVSDGTSAEIATLLSLAVITGYPSPIELRNYRWTGPEHTPEQLQEIADRLAAQGIFRDE